MVVRPGNLGVNGKVAPFLKCEIWTYVVVLTSNPVCDRKNLNKLTTNSGQFVDFWFSMVHYK